MHRAFAALLFLVSCEFAEREKALEEQRRKLTEARQNRWDMNYAPAVRAACKDAPDSLECTRVRVETKQQFDADEREIEAARGQAVNDRRAAEQPPRKPVVCSQVGTTTVCN